jgi:hypothetical protein
VKFVFFVVEKHFSAPCCRTPIRLTTKISKSTKGLNSAVDANLNTFCWLKRYSVAEFEVIEVTRSDLTAKDAKRAKGKAMSETMANGPHRFVAFLGALGVLGGESGSSIRSPRYAF